MNQFPEEEGMPATPPGAEEDLERISEEVNPAERAEYEQKAHLVQPMTSNKLVFFYLIFTDSYACSAEHQYLSYLRRLLSFSTCRGDVLHQ